jgi:uncharacterized membrane protein
MQALAPVRSPHSRRLLVATLLVVFSTTMFSLSLHWLIERGHGMVSGSSLVSTELWRTVVAALAGETRKFGAQIPLVPFLIWTVGGLAGIWIVGSTLGAWLSRSSVRVFLTDWGNSWKWLLVSVIPVAGSIFSLTFFDADAENGTLAVSILAFFEISAPWFCVIAVAGCFAGWSRLALPLRDRICSNSGRGAAAVVGLLMLCYVVLFTAMNWRLYENLLVPHGDSAMYEEHLWNVTHGKGFRSYLDQGLFLGEHIQVLHLALIPLHLVWPSHLMLELAESVALAIGAIPVYIMTRRMTGSAWAAGCLSATWLFYFPLHFLDISIDIKTFRPISLGVPALMFALERIERGRLKAACFWIIVAVAAKEDFAVIVAPLGLWIAVTRSPDTSTLSTGRRTVWGCALAALAVAYVALTVTSLIPAFRAGEVVHYTRYFGKLGSSPSEIANSLMTQPDAVFARLFSLRTAIYTGLLLVPVGFVSCLSPLRMAVAGPLFCVLSLMQLTNDPDAAEQLLIPFHHFHAPLIPVIFWSAAGGLKRFSVRGENPATTRWLSSFCIACAAGMMSIYSMCPAGIGFWDSGSDFYHQTLYAQNERAKRFSAVFEQIPIDARVASTDFVHPRFTHHGRSYDYSKYARRVSGYELRVPVDTDYIVIDTQHRYSEIQSPEQIVEFVDNPDDWELLPNVSDGYFIVLKRIR